MFFLITEHGRDYGDHKNVQGLIKTSARLKRSISNQIADPGKRWKCVFVVVQIYPWFKFYLPAVLGYSNV